MACNLLAQERDQLYLLPPSMADWLPRTAWRASSSTRWKRWTSPRAPPRRTATTAEAAAHDPKTMVPLSAVRLLSRHPFHLGAFSAWLHAEHPGVSLSGVKKLHVKAFLLHEAARGLAPITRSTALYAIRSFFGYLSEEEVIEEDDDPTLKVTVHGAAAQRTSSIPRKRRTPSAPGRTTSPARAGRPAPASWRPSATPGSVSTSCARFAWGTSTS